MRFYEKYEYFNLAQALDLFTPFFVMRHDWNAEDGYGKVKASKREYIKGKLVQALEIGEIPGKFGFLETPDISPDGDIHPVIDERSTKLQIRAVMKMFSTVMGKEDSPEPTDLCGTSSGACDGKLDQVQDLPEEVQVQIQTMPVPILRKKVKELTAEKMKWDRSIAAATKVGLLFYERDLQRPAKEKDFKTEFKRYLDDLPGTTITKIYKSLPISPIQYKKTGDAPTKQPAGIDDESLDLIIEAAVASGIIASEAEFKDAKELEQLFTRFEFEIPPTKYLKVISGAARRVLKQYNQAKQPTK